MPWTYPTHFWFQGQCEFFGDQVLLEPLSLRLFVHLHTNTVPHITNWWGSLLCILYTHTQAHMHTNTHTHTFSFPLRMTVSTFIYETATPITPLTSSFLFPYEEALPWKQIKHTLTDKHSRVNETSLQVSSTSILLAPTKTSDTVLLMRGDLFTGAWFVFCYLLVIWFHFWAETGEEYKRK